MDEVSKMMAGIMSNVPSSQLISTSNFLSIVSSNEPHPIVDKVINSEVMLRFVEFLQNDDFPMLQNETACVLTKLAYKNATVIVDIGALPVLVNLASNTNGDRGFIREEATLALGTVACDSLQNRNYVLGCGALITVLAQIRETNKLSMLRTATWTLANLCREQPPLLFDKVKLVLAELVETIDHVHDNEIFSNACGAFYYLSYRSKDGIQSLIEVGLVPQLVEFLQNSDPAVFAPALSIIGSIATGDNQQTQIVIDSGALPILACMLTQDYYKTVDKEACWTVSNITAGTEEQIQVNLYCEC